jgi:hypothetical protein
MKPLTFHHLGIYSRERERWKKWHDENHDVLYPHPVSASYIAPRPLEIKKKSAILRAFPGLKEMSEGDFLTSSRLKPSLHFGVAAFIVLKYARQTFRPRRRVSNWDSATDIETDPNSLCSRWRIRGRFLDFFLESCSNDDMVFDFALESNVILRSRSTGPLVRN